MTEVPADILQKAEEAYHLALHDSMAGKPDYLRHIGLAILAVRARIVARLLEEAERTPCAEDAVVTRSNARLIEANFSYEEAERLAEKEEGRTND